MPAIAPCGPRPALFLLLLLSCTGLPGCYYAQAVGGQLEIWRKQRPVDEVIADPATDRQLADRLRLLQAARAFATSEMLLPDNGSYRRYADLGRPYVLWNVIAAPEFSLEPKTWCYLVVGCLAYRGYFDADDARGKAESLQGRGYDVFVAGVPAYSTLGRFSDPLLNTMMHGSDADLVALLFHELAHQRLYVDDATGFNESYASAVAEFGLAAFEDRHGPVAGTDSRGMSPGGDWMAEIRRAREELRELFGSDLPAERMRVRKREIYARLERRLEQQTGGDWESASLNNARLATLSLYRGYLPAFRRMFADCDSDWSCLHTEAGRLGELTAAAREDALARLARAGD